MLLTLTSTNVPATDLGYLLHKNPSTLQSFPLSFGQAHVFYPEAAETFRQAVRLGEESGSLQYGVGYDFDD